jgi:hypothetical protein
VASLPDKRDGEVWVLDTETKGTGANMVPLERVLRKGSDRVPGFALPERRHREPAPPEPRKPRRFRIVDLMTREVLADDVDARQAITSLADVRSIVDVSIYAWDEAAGRWIRLTFSEAQALWNLRNRVPSANRQDSNPSITKNPPNGG